MKYDSADFHPPQVFIADAPRRTLAAPMLELNIETAYLIINTCPNLQMLGNLICWNITSEEVVCARCI